MKYQVFITAALLLCAGCATLPPPEDPQLRALGALLCPSYATLPPPAAHDLVGEWRFTYVQKARTLFDGMNPNPPSFDVIEFTEDGGVRLADSMMRRKFVGKYTLDRGSLCWEFSPPDMEKPVVHRLDCLWTENGRALVLRLAKGEPGAEMETEWVYYRPDRLLTTGKICGEWVASKEGKTADMTFAADGTYWTNGKSIWGYYRLWPSRYGNTLTTSIWIQGEGAFMLLYLFQVKPDSLTLTPLTPKGPDRESAIEWSRVVGKTRPNE